MQYKTAQHLIKVDFLIYYSKKMHKKAFFKKNKFIFEY